jgi:hypothetical protein
MSGGRQMTSHFGSVQFNFPTGSTMTGSQCLPAAGRAEALVLEGAERERVWQRIVARYPFFAEHQAKVTRQIPVIALERHED